MLLLLLVLPALQSYHPFVRIRHLGGYTDAIKVPPFRWATLWDGSFQPALEDSLNDKLGFRPWLVRLRNQVVYTGLDELLATGVVLGKDQNLYQQGSINAYLGRQYMGEEEISFRAKRLRRVQDSLAAHGTQLLFVIAPGKARIMPQYLPDTCGAGSWPSTGNYAMTCQQFAKYGVNTLDAAALMLKWRDAKTAYPLFPRTGTHWSGYAVARVADTLFHRVEALTGRDLPDFSHPGRPTVVTRVEDLCYTDNDLGELINLARDIPPYPMAYPRVTFASPTSKQRLNTLIIGDSYAQSFYGFYPYYEQLLTPESRFWSYNLHVNWPTDTPGESRDVADLNLAQQLHGRNLILFVVMEENLNNLGFYFITQAFDVFCPLNAKDEARTREIMASIQTNPEWMAKVTQRAQQQSISVEESLHQNAAYMHDRER